jgi:hypothetical protein
VRALFDWDALALQYEDVLARAAGRSLPHAAEARRAC